MCGFSLESLGSEQMADISNMSFEYISESWYPSGTGKFVLRTVVTFVTHSTYLVEESQWRQREWPPLKRGT